MPLEGDEDGTVASAMQNIMVVPTEDKKSYIPLSEAKKTETAPPKEPDDEPPPVDEPSEEPPPPEEEPVDQEAAEEADVDVDDIELEVLVDGKLTKAKIKELKDKFSLTGATEKRLQEATELRTSLEARNLEMHQILEGQKQRLANLDRIIAESVPGNIDWEALRVKDPGRYLLERDRAREIGERRRFLQEEHNRLSAEQQRISNEAKDRYMRQEALALIEKVPDLVDPEKSKTFMSSMATVAQQYGYSQNEFNDVTDHRALMVLRDAANWRAHVAASKKTVQTKEVAGVKPLMKAQGKGTTVSAGKRLQEALRAKARTSGKVDDVAATLLVRPARRTV